jgi:hypothetical protein
MRARCLAVIAATLILAAPATAIATPIQYNVDLTVGGVTAKGVIETDGTLGNLSESNFTNFSIILSNGTDYLLEPGFVSASSGGSGDAIQATADGLFLNFDFGGGSLLLGSFAGGFSYLCFVCNEGSNIEVRLFNQIYSSHGHEGFERIASVPAPIVGAGLPVLMLAALGMIGWRRHRLASAH